MAKQIHVSSPTVQSFFQILVDTLVAYQIPPFYHSVKKQIQQAPKYYFFDCGVINAIRKEINLATNLNSYRGGKLFESFMIQEVKKIMGQFGLRWNLYHWRTLDNHKVDLIIEKNKSDKLLAIEFKTNSHINNEDTKHLVLFQQENPNSELYVVCTAELPREILFQKSVITILPYLKFLKMLN